jgi:glycine/D-amino acid oxidase-like deaminating enzyme
VIGAGVVGVATAWLLLRQGHRVQLLDTCLQGRQTAPSGSRAALGVLMAQVFHRSSGRAWRLRQRSLELWQQWIALLEAQGHSLPRRQGVLLLASSSEDWERQQRLVAERQRQGIPLELWSVEQLEALQPLLPGPSVGALYSPNDGQIDPGPVIEALLASSRLEGLQTRADRAVALQRQGCGWLVSCEQGSPIAADWLVITAGVGSHTLVEDLGHPIAMEPVLGQALELALPARGSASDTWQQWPGVVVWQGVNLVPKPMANGVARLWLGATLETSAEVDPAELAKLRHLHGHAPPWLLEASVERSWQGVRPHPLGQPAPVLKALEPTLLLASGHYRNGVLLAPASAEWVSGQITSIR